MCCWLVNQNQTYKAEIGGGFKWAPKVRSDCGSKKFYDNLMDVLQCDLKISFALTIINAIGIAIQIAEIYPKCKIESSGMDC